jgi:hypothetical protein
MFEIGDDLPTLGTSPERLSLVKNVDLMDMARLGRASIPIDLMTYTAAEDQQPSVFLLKESSRQTILTVFNWTERSRTRPLNLARLGLKASSSYRAADVLGGQDENISSGTINLTLKPHSVRMIKLVDDSVPPIPPTLDVKSPGSGAAGETLEFKAEDTSPEAPVLAVRWDFGDGTIDEGIDVNHTYTHAGTFQVIATATGMDSVTNSQMSTVTISGEIPTRFDPSKNRRAE